MPQQDSDTTRCSALARATAQPGCGTKVVKAVATSRPARADEWALRQGMSIAKRHMPSAPFEKYAALATDVAEAIQSAWDHSEMMARGFPPQPERVSPGDASNTDPSPQTTPPAQSAEF